MRVVVIGGTGHIGSYLTPRLFEAGHDVVCVSRGTKKPYREHEAWSKVRFVEMDRTEEEAAGAFGEKIAALEADVVMDLTCYLPESASQLVEALRGRVGHLLHCGTIWVHGQAEVVPTTEDRWPRTGFGEYGERKVAIEAYLLEEAKRGLPVTLLHPGHLVGPGWNPINPLGNFNPEVFSVLARGEELVMPNFGMETVHHVHSDDVAQCFMRAMESRDVAVGEEFHVVSAAAITLRGFAMLMAQWFGCEARLKFVSWDEFAAGVSEKEALTSWNHLMRSSNCSIAKARRLLGYEPRYSSMEAVQEAVGWMVGSGVVMSS